MYIDFHCDTLMWTAAKAVSADLYDNKKTAVDFKRMKEAGQIAQFFAIFMDTKEQMEKYDILFPSDDAYFAGRIKNIKDNLKKYSDIVALATNNQTLQHNIKNNKLSVFITLEEGRMLNNALDKLDNVYHEGVRLITLTWNYENSLGFPNSRDTETMNKGLKPFGKAVVEKMTELGMLVDVSHLSDGGFWDVADILKTPFIASHSNCRSLDNHPRNLSDKMIREIADHGGVVGLNFSPDFLNQSQIQNQETKKIVLQSKIDDMIRHLKHVLKTGGEDILALGSDLDGISGALEISNPLEFEKLFMRMKREGFTENQIEKLQYKNAERIIKEVLK